jgi:protocatechuate 3,4-dioxygenase beta subunit
MTRLLTALALTASGALFAQQPPQVPARDGAQADAPKSGTAILRGRVVDAQSSQPLRRVRLALTAPDIPPPQAITVSTDADGRYEFTGLPARGFTLTASRIGYLSLRFGQRRPNEQGKVLDIQNGQTLEGVDFALPRMSAISGRIVDELGEPIAGVWVGALRLMWWQNRRQLAGAGRFATTDEDGAYRITGLTPGSYVVVARTLDKWIAEIGGRDETLSYAPSYYPGTSDVSEATRVTVAAGRELTNTDFHLVPGRAARLSGRAIDSEGRPLQTVMLTHQFPGGPEGGLVGMAGNASVKPDGTFTIAGVPPGDYRLQATGPQETAIVPISINSVDIDDALLTTSAGWSLSGQITADGKPLTGLRRNQITLAPLPLVTSAMGMMGGAVPRLVVNDDLTFSVTNIAGPARLRVTLPDGWAVRALQHGGRDLAAAPIDLKSGEKISDVQLVLTNRVATLSGRLVDANDLPLVDGTIVVFATDRAKWYESSPHVRAVRPDQQGRYRVGSLLPGEYFAVALDYVEQGIWNDPDYLESIRPLAQRVACGETAACTVSLKLVTP